MSEEISASEERSILEQISLLEIYLLSVPKCLLIIATSDNEAEKAICEEIESRIKDKVLIERFTFNQHSTEQLSLSHYLSQQTQPSQQSALFVFGLDNLPKDPRSIAINALNWGRERLRWAGYAVVLWVKMGTPAELGNRAPDFFSWRSDVFEFNLPKDYSERQQILAQLKLFANAEAGINQLWDEYCNYVVQKYDWVEFQELRGNNTTFKFRLEDIFIPLTLTKTTQVVRNLPTILQVDDVSSRHVDRQERPIYESKQEFSLEHLLNYKQSIILGEPGSGKSTLLHYIAISFAKNGRLGQRGTAFKEPLLPILVSLPVFIGLIDVESFAIVPLLDVLEDLLVTYFFKEGLPDFSKLFQKALSQNQVIILLDGLDELSPHLDYTFITTIVSDFIKRYPSVHIIITHRPIDFDKQNVASEFEIFSISPLTDFAISEFAKRWSFAFEARTSPENIAERAKVRANSLLREIRKTKIGSITRSPILLTLLTIFHSQFNVLPNRRVNLYKLFIETLTNTRYSEEFLLILAAFLLSGLTNKYSWDFGRKLINQTLIVHIFAFIAYKLQTSGESLIARKDLEVNVAEFFLDKELSFNDAGWLAKEFVALASPRTGIVVERTPNLFGFLHTGLQEYLAAYYLSKIENKEARFNSLKNHLHSLHWQETILLTAASLQHEEAEKFLQQILNAHINFNEFFDNLSELKQDELDRNKVEAVLYSIADLFLVGRCLEDMLQESNVRIKDSLFKLFLDVPFLGLRNKLIDLFVYLKDSFLGQDLFNFLLQLVLDEKQKEYLRADAILAISEMEVKNSDLVKLLLKISQDKNEPNAVRSAAVKALGKVGRENKEVIEVLLKLMKDEASGYINTSFTTSLGQVCETDTETIDLLISILTDSTIDEQVRANAAWSLGEINSEKVAKVLLQMLDTLSVPTLVRRGVASALGKSVRRGNTSIVGLLLNIIRDFSEDESVRENLISSELAKLSQTEKEITGILMSRLLNKNRPEAIRWGATITLSQIGEFSQQEIDALIAILQDKKEGSLLRRGVASVLGAIGKNKLEIINALVSVFMNYSDDEWVRGQAVSALSKVGKGNKEVLNALFSHTIKDGENYVVRGYVLETLWGLLIPSEAVA